MRHNILNAAKVSILALVLSFGLSYVYAWTAPASNPPAGNVSAPINTGSTAQTKNGSLTVGGLTSTGDVCITGKCLSTVGGGGSYTDTDTLGTVVARGASAGTDISVNGVSVGRGAGSFGGNVALGANTLAYSNYAGHSSYYNTAIGEGALLHNGLNGNGSYNTAVGFSAYSSGNDSNTTLVGAYTKGYGSNNTALGYNSGTTNTTLTNATAIGAGATVGTSNTIQLGDGNVTAINTSGAITAGADVCNSAGKCLSQITAAVPPAPSGLGYGQTWVDVKASRSLNVPYSNSGNIPIAVAANSSGTPASMTIRVGGVTVSACAGPSSLSTSCAVFAIVPPSSSYVITGSGIGGWSELR